MNLKSAAAIAAIALLTAILTLHRLGAGDVCTGNEAVEGVFVQQMVEHGHVLFPVENGIAPMYKPPLFHWIVVAIDRLGAVRKVTAANLRLPSALYAVAGAVLTMLFAFEFFGIDAAVLAGLALAASYQYISQGRYGRVDMTLCFFESLALFAFLWWMPRDAASSGPAARFESSMPALYLMAVAVGLGGVAEHRGRQILTMLDPGAIILGAAIASSWYLACYFGGRFAFLNRQLDSENVGRFFGSLGAMAPWYYLKPVLLNSAPLSLIVPVAAVYALLTPLLAQRRFDSTSSTGKDRDALHSAGEGDRSPAPTGSDRARYAVRLFAIFYFATVVFFSIAAYKRRSYLLPV